MDTQYLYEQWREIIADEELFEAVMHGQEEELAQRRNIGLTDEQRRVFEELRAQHKGVRWSVENLRYRCALQVAETVSNRLPRTVDLLTGGDPEWMQEICFEYLAYHHWDHLGYNVVDEVSRFGRYVYDRICKRRRVPKYLSDALEFELQVVELLKHTGRLTADDWSKLDRQSSWVEHGPATVLVESPNEITEWLRSGDASGPVHEGPCWTLVYIPRPEKEHRLELINADAAVLFRLSHRVEAPQLFDILRREFVFSEAEITGQLRVWSDKGIVTPLESGTTQEGEGADQGPTSLGVVAGQATGLRGVQVEVVDPRGTLGWAGVRRGDVLEGLGGERLGGSLDEWRSAFDRMGVGAKVTVDVNREGQRSRIETEVLPRRALSPRGEDIADSSVSPRQVVFEKLMEV